MWVEVNEARAQLSVAVGGVQSAVAEQRPGRVETGPMSPGQPTITGAVVSRTVITWLEGAEAFPQASVATQVRVTVKLWGQGPGAVDTLRLTTGLGSQLSVAVTGAGDMG